MTSRDQPQLGAASFSCPHCKAVVRQDWFSPFLKAENPTEVVVLTLEAAMTLRGQDNVTTQGEQSLDGLQGNVLTYEDQNPPRTMKVKLVNLHVSRCSDCKGLALWVRDQLIFPVGANEAPQVTENERHVEDSGDLKPSADVHEPAEHEEYTQREEEDDFEEAAAILKQFPRGTAALMRISIQNMIPLFKQSGDSLGEKISSLVGKGLEAEIREARDSLQVLRSDVPHSVDLDQDSERATGMFQSLKAILQRRMLKK